MIFKTSLFEIPIYKSEMPAQKEMKQKFKDEIMSKLEGTPPNNHRLNIYSDYFGGIDKLGAEWLDYYNPVIDNFMKKAGFSNNKKWKKTIDLWYNIGVKGSQQEEHDHTGGHPSCVYSAIHYLIFDPTEQEPTVFFNPIHNLFLRNMHPTNGNDDEQPDDWHYPWHIPKVKEGDILFFPSYVRHAVPYQESNKVRATIALNLTISGS